jgi:hypothetical protein
MTDSIIPDTSIHVLWCVNCGVRLRRDETESWGCPKCGCQGNPCDTKKDVFVQVNWHELHILGCWAERWAEYNKDAAMLKTLHAITRRLEQQWSDMGPLTLSCELDNLKEQLADQNIELLSNTPTLKPFITIGPGAVGFSKKSPDILPE